MAHYANIDADATGSEWKSESESESATATGTVHIATMKSHPDPRNQLIKL